MTRIEEIREHVNSNLNDYLAPCGGSDIKFLLSHIDTQAAEIASIRQQVESLRGALEHIGNRSASPWVQKDCPSALAADGERGG